MAGLLDGLFNSPETMGLLTAAAAMAERSGPSTRPTSFGQVMSSGLLGGMQGYQGVQQSKMLEEYKKAQIDALKSKSDATAQELEWKKSFLAKLGGGQAPSTAPAMPGQLGSGTFGDFAPPAGQPAVPQQSQASGNGFPLTMNDVLGAKIAGIGDFLPEYKLAQEGFQEQPGTFRRGIDGTRKYIPDVKSGIGGYDEKTNSLIPISNFASFQADVEGKKTAAVEEQKARYAPLDPKFVGEGGRPIGGSVLDYVAPRQGLDTSKLTPQQREYLQKQDPEAFNNGVSKFTGSPSLQSEADRVKQIGDIQGRQGAQVDVNKNWITNSMNPVIEQGRAATSLKNNVTALRSIDLKTGSGTDNKAAFANFLTGIGVAPDNAKLFATNYQRFQSVAMDTLLNKFTAQKGPQTEGDAQRVMATYASTKNTPMANLWLADFAEANANMDSRRAAFYQDALPLALQEGDLSKIDREWQKIQGSIWEDPILKKWVKQ